MNDASIAMLRGINVGGRGKLPMKDLREILEGLGATEVETYIQSGNAVFRGVVRGAAISAAIEKSKGFRPDCIVMSKNALASAIRNNPFTETMAEPKTLHFFFLSDEPKIDTAKLDAAKSPAERYSIKSRVFYLHSPGGLSASKIAAGLERRLGVSATGRNWNTVSKLAEMAKLL